VQAPIPHSPNRYIADPAKADGFRHFAAGAVQAIPALPPMPKASDGSPQSYAPMISLLPQQTVAIAGHSLHIAPSPLPYPEIFTGRQKKYTIFFKKGIAFSKKG
jgi:hypothetical protein